MRYFFPPYTIYISSEKKTFWELDGRTCTENSEHFHIPSLLNKFTTLYYVTSEHALDTLLNFCGNKKKKWNEMKFIRKTFMYTYFLCEFPSPPVSSYWTLLSIADIIYQFAINFDCLKKRESFLFVCVLFLLIAIIRKCWVILLRRYHGYTTNCHFIGNFTWQKHT
jgi:hypothetical protein